MKCRLVLIAATMFLLTTPGIFAQQTGANSSDADAFLGDILGATTSRSVWSRGAGFPLAQVAMFAVRPNEIIDHDKDWHRITI
jgi:hypothetical protein